MPFCQNVKGFFLAAAETFLILVPMSKKTELQRIQALLGREAAADRIGISPQAFYRYRTGKRDIPYNIKRRITAATALVFGDSRPQYKTLRRLRKKLVGRPQSISKLGKRYFWIEKVVEDVSYYTQDIIQSIVDSYRGKQFVSFTLKIKDKDGNWYTLSNTVDPTKFQRDTTLPGPLESMETLILTIWLKRYDNEVVSVDKINKNSQDRFSEGSQEEDIEEGENDF